MEQYDADIVIVGAGTAGCVLASRLSENPDLRVLLLEAGGSDRNLWVRVPSGIIKAIEVEAGLALPADAIITLSKSDE